MNQFENLPCRDCPAWPKSLFAGLSGASLDLLREAKTEARYAKGDALFRQGAEPGHVFCLRSGSVKVTQSGPAGREVIVRMAPEGDLAGHRSLFETGAYRGGATAVSDTVACSIPRATMLALVTLEPPFALHLLAKITKDMATAEDRIVSNALRSGRQRVAEVLLALTESHGAKAADGSWSLDLDLSRSELSSLTSLAEETFIRFLSELREEKVVEVRGRSVRIADLARLRTFA